MSAHTTTTDTTTSGHAAVLTALKAIVLECMDYPPVRPYSSDSYLPDHLVKAAQLAIEAAELGGADHE